MSAGTSASFCLIICFLVCSSDAQKIITAELGQNVILPCKVPNKYNIGAVQWSRPDQEGGYVIFYWNGHIDPNNQHPSYQNRVDLQDKEMKDGDVSLILKNVKMEDTGTYECRVFEEGKNEPISIITLEVLPSDQTMKGAEKITVDLGQDVILPCKVPNNININNIAVQWSRPEMKREYVLSYHDGRLDPHSQHPSYQNRVDLQDKDMKDGNFSLILKNVMMEDTGTYECRIFEEGKNEPISIIDLKVLLPDNPWKTSTIVVGVFLGVSILLNLAFVLFYRKKKKEWQEERERLKGNNPEINNQLQQEEQENEKLEDEQIELERNNPEINNLLQQEEQENENLEDEQEELDELNSDTNSDPTGSDEKNQQEEGEPLAAGVHE